MSKRLRQRVVIDGKEYWITGEAYQDLFEAYLRKVQEVRQIVPVPEQKQKTTPFMDYAWKWFKLYHTAKVSEGTARNTRTILNKHYAPYFSSRNIEGITTDDIQAFFNTKRSLSQSTCQKLFIYLHQIFDYAVHDELVKRNPADSRWLSYSKKKTIRQPLSCDHANDVLQQLEAIQGIDRLEVGIPLLTGIRRGEFLGLRWEDVDFEHDMLRIERAIKFSATGNQPVIGPPKSDAGVRYTPIVPELREILLPFRKESGYLFECNTSKPTYADDYVGHRFDDDSKPKTQTSYRNDMIRIKKQIDMHGAGAQGLRHTFATIAAGKGIDVKTLQGIMGHSDVQVTLEVYAHIQNEKIQAAGQVLAGMYSGTVM